MVRAISTGHDHEAHAGDRRQVGQVVGVEDERPRLAERRWAGPSPAAGVRGRGVVDPVDDAPQAGLSGPGRRAQPGGEGQVAEQDHEGEHQAADEQQRLGPDPRPEDAVEADARVPQRVGPEVDPEGEQHEQRDERRDHDPEADAPAAAHPGAVVGPARCVAGCGWAAAVAGSRRPARPRSGPRRRRRRRRTPVVGVAVVGVAVVRVDAGSAASGPGRAPRAPALRAGAAPPGSRRTGRASSAESSRYRPQGRWSASMEVRNAARTVSASSLGRIAAARAGSKRNAARITSGGAPRTRRVLGRGERPEAHLQPAVVLEDQAGQRPGDRRAETGERRIGRRPGGGGDVAEADDPLVVGDPDDRQPPAVGRIRGPGHPGAQASVADADLVLAEERRTGRRQAFGHAGRIAAAWAGPVRRAARPRSASAVSAAASAVSAAASAVSAAASAVSVAASAVSVGGVGRLGRGGGGLGGCRGVRGGQGHRVERGFRVRPHRGDHRGDPGARPCGPRARRRSGSRPPRPGGSRCRRRSASFSISRFTAGSGGAMAPASAGEMLSSGESPPNHDRSRLRWRLGRLGADDRLGVDARSGRGPTAPCRAVSAALQDGQRSTSGFGSTAEHHGQIASAVSLPSVMGSVTPSC